MLVFRVPPAVPPLSVRSPEVPPERHQSHQVQQRSQDVLSRVEQVQRVCQGTQAYTYMYRLQARPSYMASLARPSPNVETLA